MRWKIGEIISICHLFLYFAMKVRLFSKIIQGLLGKMQ